MEEELRCPVCKQFYNKPVLLPCYHALCLTCAVQLQQPATTQTLQTTHAQGLQGSCNGGSGGSSGSSGSGSTTVDSAESVASGSSSTEPSDYQEVDKLSILSETDSGVVCTSRPNSYVGTPNLQLQPLLFPPLGAGALSLSCPVCQKLVYFDENGAHNLPKYRVMQTLVERFGEMRDAAPSSVANPLCEMCEGGPGAAAPATVACEQCAVLYCDACREACHPARGPLAKHTLIEPRRNRIRATRDRERDSRCPEHVDEYLSMYCLVCKLPICPLCLHDTRHTSHDVQAIAAMCKAQKLVQYIDMASVDICHIPKDAPYKVHYLTLKKIEHNFTVSASAEILEDIDDEKLGTELSQNLQHLSEKARSTTEFIQRLKSMTDRINENCLDFEAVVSTQCDSLIAAVEARRAQLIDCIRQDKEARVRALRDQISLCTGRLQSTTALLQFCIETLKESDSAAFLQVGSMLINRVANTDINWNKELQVNAPRVSPHFDLTLDDKPVLRTINQLNFIQMKPPAPPTIIPEECSAENNSVTIAWQPPLHSYVQGYVLELDDGNGGDFNEVYCGPETICTVDGLHFHCMYNARVKAFNNSGEGEYSDLIGLQTAEVAWFTFDPSSSGLGLGFSEDNLSVSGEGWEHRVALGSVGFSRGVHYWEITIDKFDADTDPAFGIARIDVAKDRMLGKDDKGWAMYIDRQRSWFQHAGVHEQRIEGGVSVGGTIGILLDLNQHQLSFYVNEELQGGIAFRNLYGVFYPAISVNRGVSVTLHTALDAPSDTDDT